MGYPGTVEYKRQFTLWLLILLVIVCWPAAIIYYFTRPKVPVQTMVPAGYAMPQQPMAPVAAPAPMAAAPVNCPTCGKPATWVAQYNRWYCYTDQKYV
ncbi:MAG: hypothetical protein L3K19_00490 [Thermoplasmata archaeon]|nr:hypothetical protein [Thermoplasmata archaeon]